MDLRTEGVFELEKSGKIGDNRGIMQKETAKQKINLKK